MSVFGTVYRFELAWQLRSPLFWSLCVTYFLAHFLTQSTDSITIGELNFLVPINSPYQIIQNEAALAFYGLMPIMIFLVNSINRDYDARMAELVFVQPLPRLQFLLGRFIGGLTPAILVAFAGVVGNAVSLLMPWIDPERMAPYTLAPHVFSFLFVTLPYICITGICIFSITALTRSAALALAVAIVFVAINLTVVVYAGFDAPAWLDLADPSGIVALISETRFWSVSDLISLYPVGLLALNRLIWLSFAAVILAVTCWCFKFNIQPRTLPSLAAFSKSSSIEAPAYRTPSSAADYSWRSQCMQLAHQLKLDASAIFSSPVVYVVIGLIMAAAISEHGRFVDAIGTPMHPVTSLFLGFFNYGIQPYANILIIYFSGALVFRDRDCRFHEIIGASPYADWIVPVSKVLAIWLMVSLIMTVAMLTSMALQVMAGHARLELGLYLEAMFLHTGPMYFMFTVMAVLVQSLVQSKWMGMALLTVFIVIAMSMSSIGFENVLYIPFQIPRAVHSDIAGYGPMQGLINSLLVYWLFFAAIVFIIAVLCYPRGHAATVRERTLEARSRITRSTFVLSSVALFGFITTGSYIYYNTHILNEYRTLRDQASLDADYELLYGEYKNRPTPNFTQIELEIDIFPAERRVEMRGSGLMVNQKNVAISEFVLSPAPELLLNSMTVSGATAVIEDQGQGFFLYRLDEPLLPGESTAVSWDLTRISRGFVNSLHDVAVLENGTYIDGRDLLPAPGYRQDRELRRIDQRRDFGLGAAERLPRLGDLAYQDIVSAGVGSRAVVHTVISTSFDQIAVVPGERIQEWIEEDRRYFEYHTQRPIWPALSISSGRFDIAEDTWNDVQLEVYFDAKHPYNIQTMLDTSKLALDYYSAEFAPYEIPYFRVIEYPRYRTALTAFYGTVPYSEAVGFVARPERLDNLDYGILHELAHQWWGHLAYGAYMQGRMMLNETLAQYSTFMMYKTHASPEVLRYVLDFTHDSYLTARSRESYAELPVMLNEEQGYIAYNKGAINMFYLQEIIGSDSMHLALQNYLGKFALQGPPFPNAKNLVDEIRAVAGPAHQDLITDLFEKIVFHEVSLSNATAAAVDGGYDITIEFNARQFEADGQGNDTEVPLAERFEVVLFPESDLEFNARNPLYRQMHAIESGDQTLTIRIAELPVAAGIDPYHLMMDRQPDDNIIAVSEFKD